MKPYMFVKWNRQPRVPWSVVTIRKQLFERSRMNEIMNECSSAIQWSTMTLCICFLFTWLYCSLDFCGPDHNINRVEGRVETGRKKWALVMSCGCTVYWLHKPISTLSISNARANRSASLSPCPAPCPHFSLTCQFKVSIHSCERHTDFTPTVDCFA